MMELDWVDDGDGPAIDDPMLDVEVLNTMVKAAAQTNDVQKIYQLLDASSAYPYSMGVRDQILSTLMRGDFDGILQATVEPTAIEKWCLIHANVLVQQCPKLFDRWARPIPRYVRCVGMAHAQLDAADKLSVLTDPTTTQQEFLCKSLREHPHLWQELSPSWVGPKGSDLREASERLGWGESMLPKMMIGASAEDVGNSSLVYPYSVWALAQVLRTKPSRGMMSSGLCITAAQSAGARDVALAQMILTAAKRNEHSIVAHPSAPAFSADERLKMQEQVDMHAMLGSFEALLDSLVHDVLPGIDAPRESLMQETDLSQVDFGGTV